MEVLNLIIIVVSNIIELKFVKDWVGEKTGTNWDVFFFKANRLFMYCKTQTFFKTSKKHKKTKCASSDISRLMTTMRSSLLRA